MCINIGMIVISVKNELIDPVTFDLATPNTLIQLVLANFSRVKLSRVGSGRKSVPTASGSYNPTQLNSTAS